LILRRQRRSQSRPVAPRRRAVLTAGKVEIRRAPRRATVGEDRLNPCQSIRPHERLRACPTTWRGVAGTLTHGRKIDGCIYVNGLSPAPRVQYGRTLGSTGQRPVVKNPPAGGRRSVVRATAANSSTYGLRPLSAFWATVCVLARPRGLRRRRGKNVRVPIEPRVTQVTPTGRGPRDDCREKTWRAARERDPQDREGLSMVGASVECSIRLFLFGTAAAMVSPRLFSAGRRVASLLAAFAGAGVGFLPGRRGRLWGHCGGRAGRKRRSSPR